MKTEAQSRNRDREATTARFRLALFVVVASFVLGRRFPGALRILPIRLIPIVVLLSMIAWLWRLRERPTSRHVIAAAYPG